MQVIINGEYNYLNYEIPTNPVNDSSFAVLRRNGLALMVENVSITGNNAVYKKNVLKVVNTIRVLTQYAIITETTNISNCTNVYADVWDGTNSVLLTAATGFNLSGVSIGSFFIKDQAATEIFSLSNANQCRVNEISKTKDSGQPFTITQKHGTDTFIRFNYTTNTVLDFKMSIWFVYQPLNGGTLEFV